MVGLTCAVRLAEAGHRVDVLARDLPRETTSVVAAALWYPYRALPQDRVTAWSGRTYEVLVEQAAQGVPGVRVLPGTEVHRAPAPDPWWRAAVPALRRTAAPAPYADAWELDAPVVDMPVYLDWLLGRLAGLGGTVTRMSLGALPRPRPGEVVVDCAGMGARLLAGDHDVVPVRGQVLHVAGVELDRWWLDGGDPAVDGGAPTYVVPRTDVVVVGGTALEGEWSRTVDPATTKAVWARATALVPALSRGRVVRQQVGLRPVRPSVRVGADPEVAGVVHCYGHGGAGVTLSWGTAEAVAEAAAGLLAT